MTLERDPNRKGEKNHVSLNTYSNTVKTTHQ